VITAGVLVFGRLLGVFQLLKLKYRDILRLAVFQQLEVVLLESFDRIAGLVAHEDGDDYQRALALERNCGFLGLLRRQSSCQKQSE
jgi:hypothetical protein